MTSGRTTTNRPAALDASRAGGRPRNPALDEAIILATRARLVQDGYSRMTLGDIAADAGVSLPRSTGDGTTSWSLSPTRSTTAFESSAISIASTLTG